MAGRRLLQYRLHELPRHSRLRGRTVQPARRLVMKGHQ